MRVYCDINGEAEKAFKWLMSRYGQGTSGGTIRVVSVELKRLLELSDYYEKKRVG